jgi:hypothetical protein
MLTKILAKEWSIEILMNLPYQAGATTALQHLLPQYGYWRMSAMFEARVRRKEVG